MIYFQREREALSNLTDPSRASQGSIEGVEFGLDEYVFLSDGHRYSKTALLVTCAIGIRLL